jgi:hypothetical protein
MSNALFLATSGKAEQIVRKAEQKVRKGKQIVTAPTPTMSADNGNHCRGGGLTMRVGAACYCIWIAAVILHIS